MSVGERSDLLRRTLLVLETLAGTGQPASLLAVAEATGLSKASTYRVLRTLQEEGYVDHVRRRGYRIGYRSIALASLIGPRLELRQRARLVLAKLSTYGGEEVTLQLRSGEHRVMVMGIGWQPAPNRLDRPPIRVGVRSPLTTGSSGRAILAHLPEKQVERVVATYVGDAKRRWVVRELEAIRAVGYGTSISENYPNFNGISRALLDPDDGRPLGSIVITGTEKGLPEDALRELVAPLAAACQQLAPYLVRCGA